VIKRIRIPFSKRYRLRSRNLTTDGYVPSENLYERSFDLLQEKIALLDSKNLFRFANAPFCKMLGLSGLNDLAGRSIRDFIPEEFQENFESILEIMRLSFEPVGPIEVEFVSVSEKRVTTEVLMVPFDDAGVTMTHLVMRDISGWKAIQNELLDARFELENSYSSTLAGWAKALELRDLETKGHSERVTRAAVDLALNMGFSLNQAVHIRHGAMLHDIGKMAIPDQILRKPGPLNEEEWVEMKKHPVYAYDLLKSIEYLKPALGIPYNHHEKWDGSGYPLGLSGDRIPLDARLFAVIDVWDALSYPRVYRKSAWPADQVREYLQKEAGAHFDPEVVRVFTRLF
jgi:PAS domain S-box-containing protein